MSVSISKVILFSIIAGIFITVFGISRFYGVGGIFIASIGIMAFAVRHRKNKSKAHWQKHSDKRAGGVYDEAQNQKKGDENKKYKKPPNPNKKGNDKAKKDKYHEDINSLNENNL